MNDDDYAGLMLRPLDGEPAGPPGVDVPRAMRDGRRMRTRSWWPGTALAAVLTGAVVTGGVLVAADRRAEPPPILPPDPAMPAACAPARLPMGGHRSVEVTGGDATGRWQTGVGDPLDPTKTSLMVWRDGKIFADLRTDLDQLRLSDINASGVAVGSARAGGKEHPYVYRNGRLSALPGGVGEAIGINDDGVILGMIGENGQARPARWRTADTRPELLEPPGIDGRFEAIDIAPDGTAAVIGKAPKPSPAATLSGPPDANRYWSLTALWSPDGSLRTLEPPGEAAFLGIGFAHGWLYGGSNRGLRPSEPLQRYHPPTGTWQRINPEQRAVQLVGPSRHGQTVQGDPAVYVGSDILDLPPDPDAVASGSGDFGIEGVSADAHVVVGTGIGVDSDPSKPFQPIIWRCR